MRELEQTFDSSAFFELLKRASHSGYKKILLHDRMLMNCYDVNNDDDLGFHYILHIPETEAYRSDFYLLDLVLDLNAITNATKTIKKDHEARRKSLKYKPKEASIVGRYDFYHGYVLISFDYMLKDELWKTVDIEVPYPIPEMNSVKTNIESSYNSILNRIDISVPPVIIDGIAKEIREDTLDRVRAFYYPVDINGKTIKIPFLKSFFRAINKFEQFDISVIKTHIKNVYLVVHTFGSKGLTDQYIMYVEDFG